MLWGGKKKAAWFPAGFVSQTGSAQSQQQELQKAQSFQLNLAITTRVGMVGQKRVVNGEPRKK